MAHKSKRNNKDYFNNTNDESSNRIENNQISSEDLEALNLLTMQLRGILLDFYGEALIWNSTMQGISYILEKYDNIEGNEQNSTLEPDVVSLQGSYTFLVAKLIFTNISLTRFNIVSKKKAEGTFKYSLQPNIYIIIANILNIIVSYYFIEASKEIVARDNIQPIFGV